MKRRKPTITRKPIVDDWTLEDYIKDFFQTHGIDGRFSTCEADDPKEDDWLYIEWEENGGSWSTTIRKWWKYATTESLFEKWKGEREEMLPEIYYVEAEDDE